MKQRTLRIASPVLVAATVGGIIWVSAGDLTPPSGAVTSTMKTLAEIEPRTAINATNTPGDVGSIFKITQPGSYYLTGNVTGAVGVTGIVVTADDVTVDLNGFALIGVPGSLDGITASVAVNNLAVHNGTISKWGCNGVNARNAGNSQFDNLRASNNGCDGLLIGPGGTITNCKARNNGGIGILALLGSVVRGCAALSNGINGIHTQENCTVIDCTATNNTFDGINVSDNCLVQGNHSHNNGLGAGSWAGVHVGSNNRIVGNHLTGGDRGLAIAGSGNYVADNTVKGNTDNYDIAADNNLNILLCEIPESIDWPAMVTLAGSLTGVSGQHGITINAADVTIDLGGHALLGVPGSLNGINIIGASKGEIRNVEIRNGTVRNFGGVGVSSLAGFGTGYRVIGVRAIENSNGISLFGGGHLVKDCTVQGNGEDGIFTFTNSTVTGNTVKGNGGIGIDTTFECMVTGNTVNGNGGDGIISFFDSATVTGNTVTCNGGIGINVWTGSTVTGNTANDNILSGILTAEGCTVTGNATNGNGLHGIRVGAGSTVIGNTARFNDNAGILLEGNSFVDQNTAFENNLSGGSFSNMNACATCTFGLNHAP